MTTVAEVAPDGRVTRTDSMSTLSSSCGAVGSVTTICSIGNGDRLTTVTSPVTGERSPITACSFASCEKLPLVSGKKRFVVSRTRTSGWMRIWAQASLPVTAGWAASSSTSTATGVAQLRTSMLSLGASG